MNRKVKVVEYSAKQKGVSFRCPGCGDIHTVPVDGEHPKWDWNGSLTRPTLSPSLKVPSGHYAPGHDGGTCWCTYNKEHPDDPAPFKCGICHSFVVDGRIQFLGDCTHALANQTVDLADIPDEGRILKHQPTDHQPT